ncbi:MAG: hypothetical protein K2X47_15270 [Bdellovibrionales bacterium]|nr:hypothetical protein [Bdellovibrionales bacterium]
MPGLLRRFRQVPILRSSEIPRNLADSYIHVTQARVRVSFDQPLLTDGMGLCIGVAIVNSETGGALLAHVDSMNWMEEQMDEKIKELGPGKLRAVVTLSYSNREYVRMNRDGHDRNFADVMSFLDRHDITLVGRKQGDSASFLAVDPKSQSVY